MRPAYRDLVPPLARAAVAAGADGLIVEVHPDPDKAWSDGEQSLDFADFDDMMTSLVPILRCVPPFSTEPADPRPLEAVG